MTKIVRIAFVLLFPLSGFCQFENQTASVEIFVQAYNAQDFGLMQKPIGFVGKALISKKMLKKEYEPYFTKYGPLTIDTLVLNSMYTGRVQLQSKKSPLSRIFMQFNFSENGKIQGFGSGYPTFVYMKKKEYPALSESERCQRIDSIVQARAVLVAPRNFNGCVLVARGDTVYYKKCVGYSDFETKAALNDTSLFLLASCSKQFTAVAIMMLQEQGKLKITDNVKEYLPDFPYDSLTIENLLTHTSGLPDYFALIEKYGNKSGFNTNRDVLNLLINHYRKLRFTPNTVFEYSNTGYVMLSLVIESASEQSYADFLNAEIFQPLDLKHTLVYNRRKEQNALPNYALGYVYSNSLKKYILPDSLSQDKYVAYMDGITGDDGVSSCILDLKTWTEALRENTLLSAASTNAMYASHRLANGTETNYGYGFFARKGGAVQDIIYHTGSWPGYTTMIFELVERNETVIILANTDYDGLDFLADQIVFSLLR